MCIDVNLNFYIFIKMSITWILLILGFRPNGSVCVCIKLTLRQRFYRGNGNISLKPKSV